MPKKKPNCPAAGTQANAPACAPVQSCPGANPQVVKRGNITVTVDRTAKTIAMAGTQEYSGTGASQAYSDTATKKINDTWSGPTTFEGQPYTVTSNIQGRYLAPGSTPTPGTNQVNVVQTNDPPSVTSSKLETASNQTLYGGTNPKFGTGPGRQHSTDLDGGVTIVPHEFGHSMGLLDEYSEGKNPDGTRRTVPKVPGGLMGDGSSTSKPTPDNYASLITGCGLA
jgi:hypothetical protein